MDNVTHTLVGLAFGEAVAVSTKKKRVPIWITSAVANNLPDADVLLTSTFFRDKTGYLLHHRGHTHTLLLAPLLSLLILGVAWLIWRKRELPWREMTLVALLGVPLHLFADFWNSYGVHPFWPFDNRWSYGDLVFIVEPWIWALLIPPLFLRTERWWSRGMLGGLLALILGLAWVHDLVSRPAAVIFTVGVAAWIGIQWSLRRPGARITAAIMALSLVLLSLGTLSHRVKAAQAPLPGEELAANPFPANPLCWNVLSARVTDVEYIASTSVVAPFPALVKAEDCPNLYGKRFTAPFARDSASVRPERKVLGVFRAPRAELQALSDDCRVNAFLRFARVPFWKRVDGAWIVGDLRFDRDEAVSFAEEVFYDDDKSCPHLVPPWIGRFHPEALEASR